jgi:hypothetical protein
MEETRMSGLFKKRKQEGLVEIIDKSNLSMKIVDPLRGKSSKDLQKEIGQLKGILYLDAIKKRMQPYFNGQLSYKNTEQATSLAYGMFLLGDYVWEMSEKTPLKILGFIPGYQKHKVMVAKANDSHTYLELASSLDEKLVTLVSETYASWCKANNHSTNNTKIFKNAFDPELA